MVRPKSSDKRSAIMAAAVRLIARQGLGAPTLAIAQDAGVANGSLFTYFDTKVDLYNQLFLDLKTSMADAALQGLSSDGNVREQLQQAWDNWTRWALDAPERRRAMAQLAVYEEITPATRKRQHEIMKPLGDLLDRARARGALRDAPFPFVIQLMNALAETTMDLMLQDKKRAEEYSKLGFEAFWRALS